jgi:hypothetical protein
MHFFFFFLQEKKLEGIKERELADVALTGTNQIEVVPSGKPSSSQSEEALGPVLQSEGALNSASQSDGALNSASLSETASLPVGSQSEKATAPAVDQSGAVVPPAASQTEGGEPSVEYEYYYVDGKYKILRKKC